MRPRATTCLVFVAALWTGSVVNSQGLLCLTVGAALLMLIKGLLHGLSWQADVNLHSRE